MSWTRFAACWHARKTKLKALLMDQRFVAGIGNIYADEILFAAGLRYDRELGDAHRPGGAPALPGHGRDPAGGHQAPGLVAGRRAVPRPVRGDRRLPEPAPGLRPGGPGLPPVPAASIVRIKASGRSTFLSATSAARSERRRADSVQAAIRCPPGDAPRAVRRSVHPTRLTAAVAVFLKSLTLKGFKSFADPTTLEFEPGVTVVVGPNGSGKSNIVDAVAWVLGAQGPRTVRSAKMEDVIFAGTPEAARPRPGRGVAHHRQQRRPAADRLLRGHHHPDAVPHRRQRVRHQRGPLPAARHPGAAVRHRRRPPAARDRLPGPARRRPQRPPGGPPADHRGGGGRAQVPAPQGEGRAPARVDRGQPAPAAGPAPRGAPPAAAPRAPGRRRPPPRRPGRRAAAPPPLPGRPRAGRARGPAGLRQRRPERAGPSRGASCAIAVPPRQRIVAAEAELAQVQHRAEQRDLVDALSPGRRAAAPPPGAWSR